MFIAVLLFILTYCFMLSFSEYKSYIALIGATAFMAFGFLPADKILGAVDYNVIMMIFGMMGLVSLFIESKMPELIADIIIEKVHSVKMVTISLAILAGIISAFIDNVSTVIMLVPVILVIFKKIKANPVPTVIAVSIFSNLEGAATLVGDTTSIMLASTMKMNFFNFFIYEGKIGLFFIVQCGLIVAAIILGILQRNENKKIIPKERIKITDYVPTILLILNILTLIVVSFIPNNISIINGLICVFYFVVGLIIKVIKTRNIKSIGSNILDIDYQTLVLLTSLFLIIGGIKEVGVIDWVGNTFVKLGNGNVILTYTLIVFVSVFVSAFIDNIPYVATMLPVISMISMKYGMNATILYYGLIIGATLGGNFTPIGASANIAAIGILRKNKFEVKNHDYYKYSVPITLGAVLSGYILILILFN